MKTIAKCEKSNQLSPGRFFHLSNAHAPRNQWSEWYASKSSERMG